MIVSKLPLLLKHAIKPPYMTMAMGYTVPALHDIDDVSVPMEQARSMMTSLPVDIGVMPVAKDFDMCVSWDTIFSVMMSDYSLPAMVLIWAMTIYILFHSDK